MRSITVNRQKSQSDWTLSTFQADDLSFKGVGVEDEKRIVKVHGETRIDAGEYEFILNNSNRFSKEYYRDDNGNLITAKEWVNGNVETKQKYHTQHECILLLNVNNFDAIRWHWGNTDLDSLGCYIVGCVFGKVGGRDGVLNSRKKYAEIYPIIYRAWLQSKAQGYKLTIKYIDHE